MKLKVYESDGVIYPYTKGGTDFRYYNMFIHLVPVRFINKEELEQLEWLVDAHGWKLEFVK